MLSSGDGWRSEFGREVGSNRTVDPQRDRSGVTMRVSVPLLHEDLFEVDRLVTLRDLEAQPTVSVTKIRSAGEDELMCRTSVA
eukprot:1890919-Prymnesium_polylepis.1